MPTYQIYQYVSLGSLIACGIFLVIAVILFFTLDIIQVFGYLSGRTQRRAIEDIRRRNEESGDKAYKSSHVNRERGKLTDKISKSGRLISRGTILSGGSATEKIGTEKLAQAPAAETALLSQEPAGETALLSQEPAGETALLTQQNAGETSLLTPQDTGETVLLSQDMAEPAPMPVKGETSRLSAADNAAAQPDPYFAIAYEITFIHTNEVIA